MELEDVEAKSPRKVIDAAEPAGYDLRVFEDHEFIEGTVFKSGPKEGEKRPDKTIDVLYLRGKHAGVAFFATYHNGKFKEALVWDRVGWPTELFADYKMDDNERRRLGMSKERAEEVWRERDAEYNDGTEYINRSIRLLRGAIDFEEWLQDVVPGFTAKKRPQRKSKEEKVAEQFQEELAGADWSM